MSGIHYLVLRTIKGIILVLILATACNETRSLTEETPQEIVTTNRPLTSVDKATPAGSAGLSPELEQMSVQDKDARTGIEEVDRVIDIVLSHDFGARRALVRLTTAGCTRALGLGGPPKCVNGLPEETPVEYLPLLGPGEGETVLPENLDRSLDFQAESLYLAYSRRGKPDDDIYYAPGAYVLVFESGDSEGVPFIFVHLNIEGRIIRLDYAAWDPVLLMEQEADKVLFAPRLPLQANLSAVTITPTPTPFMFEGTGQILEFDVSSELERPGSGDSILLLWETAGGTAEICVSYGGRPDNYCLDVSPTGQMTYTLRTEDPVADHWADITLSVRDDFATLEEEIRIHLRCHYAWFTEDLTKWCPSGPADESEAIAQLFERGRTMVSGHLIWVLFDEPADLCRNYNLFTDSNDEVVKADPPQGLLGPGDSAAFLWQGTLPGTEDLPERLGWASSPEEAYSMSYQCERRPDSVGNCYLSAADGSVFLVNVSGVAPDETGIAVAEGTCRRIGTVTEPTAESQDGGGGPCKSPFYLAWAYHGLEELSDQLGSALEAASIEGATAAANAYGENWVEYDEATTTSRVCNFSTLETDFRVSLTVEDLADLNSLGDLLASVIEVIIELPDEAIPGAQPGLIQISFSDGESVLPMRFTVLAAEQALADGLSGADLFNALQQ